MQKIIKFFDYLLIDFWGINEKVWRKVLDVSYSEEERKEFETILKEKIWTPPNIQEEEV